jgi:hypothetical protein
MRQMVKLDGQKRYQEVIIFTFFLQMICEDIKIEEDVTHGIRVGWVKWSGKLGIM